MEGERTTLSNAISGNNAKPLASLCAYNLRAASLKIYPHKKPNMTAIKPHNTIENHNEAVGHFSSTPNVLHVSGKADMIIFNIKTN